MYTYMRVCLYTHACMYTYTHTHILFFFLESWKIYIMTNITSLIAWTHQPCLMMRYLPCTDRSTTVDPRRLWPPTGPPSTTTARFGQSSWNSFSGKTKSEQRLFYQYEKAITTNTLFYCHMFRTHMYSHCAGVRADVCAGKCKWLAAHLAQTSHEVVVWDTYTYKLEVE